MNTTIKFRLLFIILVFLTFFYSCEKQGSISSHSIKLPGARPIIDASQYPSLQDAINAVPEEGGMVKLPPGEFVINEPLIIHSPDFHLEGSGTSTHIKNNNMEGQPALLIQHPSKEDNREAELWRISLTNFRITGNENSGNGIEARRINEIFINGVTVSYHGGDGIQLYYCYEDPRVSDCLITYNKKTGLNLYGCHDIIVSANQFEENNDALFCSDSYNLCMTGNNLDDHLGNGVVIENTYGSVVAGNMIEECKGVAVLMDRDCYGTTVSANIIAHNESGGVDLRDAHGCAVSANTFTIMGKDALKIGSGSGRIMVGGNNFSDSEIGGDKKWRETGDLRAGGLVLEGTSDIGIVGNLFSDVQPGPLEIRGESSKRINFSGNVLVGGKSDHRKLAGSVIENNLE
ncbi:right-handed parallel beta-helix repeat-containing protein [Bacteroidota bacterium]